MDIPPWHFRTTIASPLQAESPITTLRDAVQTYFELPLTARARAVVTVVEPDHEGELSSAELDALIDQLPPLA
ncbi:hypothetical protein [Sphingomonas montanisoli]|uniref:Uncharacterized protein n=1 Tax=Sphingomonas montanisoli TaxID=2606412 RepID=A0A5D9C1B0_9SPHN|nr:hypothetical protein [Sphingomonas montanisoli]TZG25638.1 hypothetical protein FYJ91_11475 [Sphingomonas montanisoli]